MFSQSGFREQNVKSDWGNNKDNDVNVNHDNVKFYVSVCIDINFTVDTNDTTSIDTDTEILT